LLDVFGPLEMFGLLGDRAKITMAAVERSPVSSAAGPQVLIDAVIPEINSPDILLIPGGYGTRPLVRDPGFLEALRLCSAKTKIVASVCTGSALLAKAGLLDGRQATSNKLVFKWVASQGTNVLWQPKARWVVDGKFWTSSGIAAGIDMSLALIAHLFDEATAIEIANRAEYLWNQNADSDPFALNDG
jgi:transcriptional regulator GlxA family with amidase domain